MLRSPSHLIHGMVEETKCSGASLQIHTTLWTSKNVIFYLTNHRFFLVPLFTKYHRLAPWQWVQPLRKPICIYIVSGYLAAAVVMGMGATGPNFSKSFCKSLISNNKTYFNLFLINITHIPFIKKDKVTFV